MTTTIQQKMICLYKTTMDDLIFVFKQNVNYMLWLKVGYTSTHPNSTSLSLNVATKCGDPKLVVDGIKSYPRA